MKWEVGYSGDQHGMVCHFCHHDHDYENYSTVLLKYKGVFNYLQRFNKDFADIISVLIELILMDYIFEIFL